MWVWAGSLKFEVLAAGAKGAGVEELVAESPTPGVSPGLSLGRTGGNAAQVTYRGLWNVDRPDSTTLLSRNPTGPREGLQREHTAGAAARGWQPGRGT